MFDICLTLYFIKKCYINCSFYKICKKYIVKTIGNKLRYIYEKQSLLVNIKRN